MPESTRAQNPAVAVVATDPATIAPAIEAILLSTDKPVSMARLAEALRLDGGRVANQGDDDAPADAVASEPSESAGMVVRRAIDHLNGAYEQTGRSFRIEHVAGGYRVMTLARFADAIAAFQGSRARAILSHAAVETLAIIAYKQPVTRSHLEAIRGVACGDILRSLIERRLVAIVGRAEELGRPILYGTSKRFLETFGLASLKDLPSAEELRPKA